jgi:hypothetical protein
MKFWLEMVAVAKSKFVRGRSKVKILESWLLFGIVEVPRKNLELWSVQGQKSGIVDFIWNCGSSRITKLESGFLFGILGLSRGIRCSASKVSSHFVEAGAVFLQLGDGRKDCLLPSVHIVEARLNSTAEGDQ